MVIYVIALVMLVVACVMFYLARRKSSLRQTMQATATTTVRNLRDGELAELKGRAVCAAPLKAPFTDQPCLYYEYKVEQRETRRRSDGSTSSQWRTIDQGSNYASFELDDGTGLVRIDGTQAQFDAQQVCRKPLSAGSGLNIEALGMNFNLGGRPQRVTVKAVPAGGDLYVLGTAQRQADGTFCMVKAEGGRLFVSHRSEQQIIRSLGREALWLTVGSVVCAAAAVSLAVCQAAGVFGGKS